MLLYMSLYTCEKFLNNFFEVGIGFKTVHITGHHVMAEGIVGLGENTVKQDKHAKQV